MLKNYIDLLICKVRSRPPSRARERRLRLGHPPLRLQAKRALVASRHRYATLSLRATQIISYTYQPARHPRPAYRFLPHLCSRCLSPPRGWSQPLQQTGDFGLAAAATKRHRLTAKRSAFGSGRGCAKATACLYKLQMAPSSRGALGPYSSERLLTTFPSAFAPDGALWTCTLLGRLARHKLSYDEAQRPQVETVWKNETKSLAKVNTISVSSKWVVLGGITQQAKGLVEVWALSDIESVARQISNLSV